VRETLEECRIEGQLGQKECVIEFLRVSRFVDEVGYGADADGNRGTCVVWLDLDRFEDVYVNGQPIGTLQADEVTEIEEQIEEWLLKNPPEDRESW
jgi:hypothetical protein